MVFIRQEIAPVCPTACFSLDSLRSQRTRSIETQRLAVARRPAAPVALFTPSSARKVAQIRRSAVFCG
jgi:hypothetical protein